jgi:pimeloyl-ACP methyl ester carboxylesterase
MNTQLGSDDPYGQAHTLRRDGYEVRYWDGGTRDGPVLVFSHGAGLDHRMFEPQVRRFASEYRVVTWDAPGHGLSKPLPRPYRIPAVADDLLAVLDEIRVGQAVFIGLSMGGTIVQEVLFRHPERVLALIAMDTGPITVKATALETLQALPTVLTMMLYPWDALRRAVVRSCSPQRPETGAYIESALAMLSGKADFNATMTGTVACVHPDPAYRLPKPTLLLLGDHDRLLAIPNAMRAWAARDTGCRLVMVRDAGHLSNYDQPDQVNNLIAGFIGATLPARQPEAPEGKVPASV